MQSARQCEATPGRGSSSAESERRERSGGTAAASGRKGARRSAAQAGREGGAERSGARKVGSDVAGPSAPLRTRPIGLGALRVALPGGPRTRLRLGGHREHHVHPSLALRRPPSSSSPLRGASGVHGSFGCGYGHSKLSSLISGCRSISGARATRPGGVLLFSAFRNPALPLPHPRSNTVVMPHPFVFALFYLHPAGNFVVAGGTTFWLEEQETD